MKKFHVKIVVPKLQQTIFYGTWKDVHVKHCIIPTVPTPPQIPKVVWIIIFLKSTAPQNLMSPSNVNFVIKIFQFFTLHVNIETINTEARSDQEEEMWM